MDGSGRTLEKEDIRAIENSIAMYGIVSLFTGIISLFMLMTCYGCSPLSPVPILVGWLCMARAKMLRAEVPREKRKNDPTSTSTGLGLTGLILGGISLSITLLWSLAFGFGFGCVSIGLLNS